MIIEENIQNKNNKVEYKNQSLYTRKSQNISIIININIYSNKNSILKDFIL